MKFKELLEKYAAEGRSKEWELMIRGYMPLTPSILKEFEIFIPETYHITSVKRVPDIIKLQNKKVDISTFTIGSTGISGGAIENGEVIFTLEGYSSFDASQDINTFLDRNGHRWLDPYKDKDYIVNNKFSIKIYSEIVKEYNLDDRHSISSFVTKMDGKEKAKFIKFYYDASKKIINKKLLEEIKNSIARNYKMGGFDNNEILLHNFKIKDLKILGNSEREEYIWHKIQDIADIDVSGYLDFSEVKNIGK